MAKKAINIPFFLLAFLALAAVWHFSATIVLDKLFPIGLSDLSARANQKQWQYFVVCWALAIPVVLRYSPDIDSSGVRLTFNIVTILSTLVVIHFFGVVQFVVWAIVVTFLSRAHSNGAAETKTARFFVNSLLGALAVLTALHAFKRTGVWVFDLYEYGPRLSAINEYLHGAIPYKDFFIHYGILQDVVRPWIAFKMWGTTYAADQALTAWIVGMASVLLFSLMLLVVRRTSLKIFFGIILALRPDLFFPERTLFPLLTMALFCASTRQENRLLYGLAGIVAALSALYSFEIGVTLIAGLALFFGASFILDEKNFVNRSFSSFLIGYSFSFLLLVLYLWHVNAFNYFFRDIGSMLTQRLPTWADGLRSHVFQYRFFQTESSTTAYLKINIPLLLSIFTMSLCATYQFPRSRAALALACVLFFQFFIYLGRTDFIHWKNSSILTWPLIMFVCEIALDWVTDATKVRVSTGISPLLATCIVLPLGSTLMWGRSLPNLVATGLTNLLYASQTSGDGSISQLPRMGKARIPTDNVKQVESVVLELQKRIPENGHYFDFTNYGGYYFLSDRRSATRFGLINYVHGASMMNECLSDLTIRKPVLALVELKNDALVYRYDLKPIADFLETNYTVIWQNKNLGLMEIKTKH